MKGKIKKATKDSEIDETFSREISIVEMNYGVVINEDYPLMKFIRQYDDLVWIKQKEAESTNG